jgi:hypothetical protein
VVHQAGKPFQERTDPIRGVPRANGTGHDGLTLAHRAFTPNLDIHEIIRRSTSAGPAAFGASLVS